MKKHNSKGKKFVLFGLIACLIFFSYLYYAQWSKKILIQKEVAELIKQREEVEGKNREIEESLKLLSDPDKQEALAREQLNLQKEGELVINFPAVTPDKIDENVSPDEKPNTIKWWNYFFNKQS